MVLSCVINPYLTRRFCMKSSSRFLKQKIVTIWNSDEEYFGFNKDYDIGDSESEILETN